MQKIGKIPSVIPLNLLNKQHSQSIQNRKFLVETNKTMEGMISLRNKAKNFPGPRKFAHPRAKTTAQRPNGSINLQPKEKLQENR